MVDGIPNWPKPMFTNRTLLLCHAVLDVLGGWSSTNPTKYVGVNGKDKTGTMGVFWPTLFFQWVLTINDHPQKWFVFAFFHINKACGFKHQQCMGIGMGFEVSDGRCLFRYVHGWKPIWWPDMIGSKIPSGYVKIAIENGHWNSEFSH